MRTVYVSALAFVVLSAGLYFAFHDHLFPAPGAPLSQIHEKVSGSGFETFAPLLRPTEKIERLDDVDFLLSPSEPFVPADVRTASVRLPDQVLEAVLAGERRFFPIEIASLAVASLRARAHGAHHAKLMEVYELDGVPSPDPTGRYGYYVVELDGEIFDVFGARKDVQVKRGRVLEDVQAVAAAGALSALAQVTRGDDVARALRSVRRAHELDPKSPSIRAIEGTLWMVTGQLDEGEQEFEAALALSPDPSRKNLVAGFKLAVGELGMAAELVGEAIAEDPALAPAYVTRAGLELARGDLVGARASLAKAEGLDPELPALAVLFAQLDLAENDTESAKRRIRAELARYPDDAQVHMAAVQVFHAAHDYDAMRRSVQAVLRLSPLSQRTMLEEQIRAVFGPTALLPPTDLDEVEEDGDDESDEAPAAIPVEIRLDARSPFGDEFRLKEPDFGGAKSPKGLRLLDE